MVICRFIELASGSKSQPDVGCTFPRRMRTLFGPLVLACLLVALRSQGGEPLTMMFQAIDHHLDRFEIERRNGLWQDETGFGDHSEKTSGEFLLRGFRILG